MQHNTEFVNRTRKLKRHKDGRFMFAADRKVTKENKSLRQRSASHDPFFTLEFA